MSLGKPIPSPHHLGAVALDLNPRGLRSLLAVQPRRMSTTEQIYHPIIEGDLTREPLGCCNMNYDMSHNRPLFSGFEYHTVSRSGAA